MTPTAINIEKLSKVPFFSALSRKQLQQVAEEAEEFGFEANQVVREESAVTDAFWILLYGSWKMERFLSNGSKPLVYETDKIGTWHSGIEVIDAIAPVKVLATSHSYIMRVPLPLMNKWIKEGFPIAGHLLSGIASGVKRLQYHQLQNKL